MDRRKLIKEAPYPPFSEDLVPLLDDAQHAETQLVWEKDTNRRTSKRERRGRDSKSRGPQSGLREYPYHPSSATPQSTYIQVQGSDERLHSSPHYHPVTPVSLYGAIGGSGARKYPRAAALRFFFFSIVSIFFIIVMYAPAYKQTRSRHASVAGWSYNTSRDTRFYVLPDNITVLHQPRSMCWLHDRPSHADSSDDGSKQSMPDDDTGFKGTRDNKSVNKKEIPVEKRSKNESPLDGGEVFLLVIVCSSMDHFAARSAIRETWGNQTNYELMAEAFQNVTNRFAKINATDKILEDDEYSNNSFLSFFSFDRRKKRDLSSVPEYGEEEGDIDFQNGSKYNNDSPLGDIKNEDSIILYPSSLFNQNSNSSNFEDSNSLYEGARRNSVSNVDVGDDEAFQRHVNLEKNDFIDNNVNSENSSNFDDVTNETKDSDKVSNDEIISSMFDRVRALEKLQMIESFQMSEYKRRHKRNVEDVSLDEAIADNKYVQQKMKKDDENVEEAADDPRFDHVAKKAEDLDEDDNILGNFEGNDVDQNDEVFEEYDYHTEVSNIMRIPPRGEKIDSGDSDIVRSAVNSAKGLLKLSIKNSKLNLIVEHSKDTGNKGENKPSNNNDKLKVSNDIKLKKVHLENSKSDGKGSANRLAENVVSDIKNMNGKNINVHRIAKDKQTSESKYLHSGNVDGKKTSNNIDKVSPSDDVIYGETIEFIPPVKTKFLFLLGRSVAENDTDLQLRIDEEAAEYGDLIQEGFVDSYNNLTLKSVMLLKWVVGNCGDKVRYVMKTDDDMFINIPRLVDALKNKSADYLKRMERRKSLEMMSSEKPKKKTTTVVEQPSKETLLMGDLICDARPISDTTSKWYSPTYMFAGKVYPRYLSGTSYVMAVEAARMLYNAALDTPLFHLEDIYITGICSRKAGIRPIDHPGFSYMVRKPDPCAYWRSVTSHQVPPRQLKSMQKSLLDQKVLTKCEVRRIQEASRSKGPTVVTAAKPKSTKKISRCL